MNHRPSRSAGALHIRNILRRSCVALALLVSVGCASTATRPASPSATTKPTTQPSSQPTTAPESPFAKWESTISEYEAADRVSPPPKGAILFIGSSTIRMWSTLATDFPEYKTINRGFGGSQLADSVHFADRIVIPYAPRMIVLNAGTNDIAAGKSPQDVFEDFKAFVAKVRAKLPETRIAYLAIQPAPSRWEQAPKQREANRLISSFIAQQNQRGGNLDYIEVWDQYIGADGTPDPAYYLPDRLHGNAAGYKIRADVVRPHLTPEISR